MTTVLPVRQIEPIAPVSGAGQASLRVVLCGSFHRDPTGLRKTFALLTQTFEVLSPVSVDFSRSDVDFVRLDHETHESVEDIEARHLDALRNADLVWLFCPDGYVGTSAALEVGYAHAAGIPVFSDCEPKDLVVAGMVITVHGIAEVTDVLRPRPGEGLAALQNYYRRIAIRRGWAGESARDTLLLLTEELGELARAVRKSSGLARDGTFPESDIGAELADVQLYLVHLANAMGVDLANAVTRKEEINAERQLRRTSAA